MDVCSYLVLHVRRGDKAAYASGHRCSYLRANCSSSKQQWRGAAGAGAKRGKGRRTSPAAAADLFLEERTWLALRRVALAAPSLPWMVISDGKATAHAARQRLNNMTDGRVRFVSLSCNGSRPAAEGMAAMTAEVLLDFFAITRARGVIAIAPNSLHQGLAESSFATVAALAGDAPHLTPAPFGSAGKMAAYETRGNGGRPMRGIFFLDDLPRFIRALTEERLRHRTSSPSSSSDGSAAVVVAPSPHTSIGRRLASGGGGSGVQCASSLDDPRLVAANGASRLIGSFGGPPLPCERFPSSSSSPPRSTLPNGASPPPPRRTSPPRTTITTPLRAIVIAGSRACFERARWLVLQPAGLGTLANWSHAAFEWRESAAVSNAAVPVVCADTQAQRMTDGTVRAHRAAWRMIVASSEAAAVFEEDAVLLGEAEDVAEAARRCEQSRCDLAYLGMSGDFFASHATLVTPTAAAMLLAQTRETCNKKKADYAIRLGCIGAAMDRCLRSRGHGTCDYNALNTTGQRVAGEEAGRAAAAGNTIRQPLICLRPPRLLWQRGLESVGIFAQDHRAITSYSVLTQVHAIPGLNQTRFAGRPLGKADGEVRRALNALRERQCLRQLCKKRTTHELCRR